MRLSFPEEHLDLQREFEKIIQAEASAERARQSIQSSIGWDQDLWQRIADLGWFSAAIAEPYGGMGQSSLALCLLAETAGRYYPNIPFDSSVIGFSEMLKRAPVQSQVEDLYSELATGNVIGTFVLPRSWQRCQIADERLNGEASFVAHAHCSTHLISLNGEGDDARLFVAEIPEQARRRTQSLDILSPGGALALADAEVRILATGALATSTWSDMLSHYAILLSFVQVGGATCALELACEHVKQRFAFGKPLGSFQAIQHGLADVYTDIAVARSNAWHSGAMLEMEGASLLSAAGATRVSATAAYRHAARACTHFFGALGATEECDAHLHYRRAQSLGMVAENSDYWRDCFVAGRIAEASTQRDFQRVAA